MTNNEIGRPLRKHNKTMIRESVGTGSVLKIGPSYGAIVPRRDGFNAKILDHASKEELQRKYSNTPVPLDSIEDVDFIGTSPEVVSGVFDHIVACHLLEHTPDMVRFLNHCSRLMHDGSRLHIIVPDKRTCFDAARPATTTGQVIDAYAFGHHRHVGAEFDKISRAVSRNGDIMWFPGDGRPLTQLHTFEQARQVLLNICSSGDYFDSYAWTFTPSSIRLLMMDLAGLKMVDLAVDEFVADPQEIYLTLRRRVPFFVDEDERRKLIRESAMDGKAEAPHS